MADTEIVDIAATTVAGGTLGLDPYFRLVRGSVAVAHSLARRLTSPRGSMFWAKGVGRDVRSLLNESIDRRTLKEWIVGITNEVRADERVDPDSITVSIVFDDVAQSLSISVGGDSIAGPFSLVLSVSKAAVALKVAGEG